MRSAALDPAAPIRTARLTLRPFEMRGKEMRGWLRVDAADVTPWVERGVAHARSLPPKA